MKTGWNVAAVSLLSLVLGGQASAAPKPDRLTPGDAEMVVQVNVRQLLQTPFIKKHALDAIKRLFLHNEEFQQLLTAAGLDPLQDIDTICLCTSGNPMAGGKLLAVVRGDFDVDKVQKAAEEYAGKHPSRLKCSQSGQLPMWEINDDNKSFYAAFAGDKTLVITAAKEDTAAVVRRAGQSPQRPSKTLQATLDHLIGGASIWMALVATEEIKQVLKNDESAKDMVAALQSITGAAELSDDARFSLVVHTNSPKAAAQIKGKLDELMPLLAFLGAGKDKSGRIVKEVIDSIEVKTETNDVSIRIHITEAQIDKVRRQ